MVKKISTRRIEYPDRAWIAGLAGLLAVIIFGISAATMDALHTGWHIFGNMVSKPGFHASLFVLGIIAIIMLLVELLNRIFIDKTNRRSFFSLAPELTDRKIIAFFIKCLSDYFFELFILTVFLFLYHFVSEYGFQNRSPYYAPWFVVFHKLYLMFLIMGLPYIFLTRALQHDTKRDAKGYAHLPMTVVHRFFDIISNREPKRQLTEGNKIAMRGILVKAFFLPLMTVFFCDQFPHLVENCKFLRSRIADVLDGTISLDNALTINDLYNVFFSLIFSIDVALAWSGYLVSSRWLKNDMQSVEPTFFGWFVALVCYPPFQKITGVVFPVPGEKAFFAMPWETVVSIMAVLSLCSYFLYLSATVVFGLRFSNLTHRGIIQTGPYRFVRHPAYAAKNLSWWLVMFPYTLFSIFYEGQTGNFIFIFGLCLLSYIYYLRAVTEEKHLICDPIYRKYCENVRYRFIPGLF